MIKRLPSIIGVLALTGCADVNSRQPVAMQTQPRVNLVERTGVAVDRLLGSMSPGLAPDTTIVVTSFANLDELSVATKLGRLIAEQAAERLIQRGYRVPEVRLAGALHINEGGEFVLSRQVEDLQSKSLQTQVYLTGTMGSYRGTTYVILKLLRAKDGVPLASSDLELADRAGNQ